MARVNAREYRKSLLENIDARLERARKIVGDLTEEQLNWRPAPHAWSVGQVLDHTAKANSKYLPPMKAALAASKTTEGETYASGFMGRLLISALTPGSKLPAPVPKALEPTTEPVDRSVIERFIGGIEDVRALLRQSEGLDLGKAVFTSPFAWFVRVRVGDAFKLLEVHDDRHILQAETIIGSAGFPHSEARVPVGQSS